MTPLELWAGPECTVNRVGDRFRDQLRAERLRAAARRPRPAGRAGHPRVRFPLLWERTAPTARGALDWSWTDERLRAAARARRRARSSGCCTTAAARATRTCSTRAFPSCWPTTRGAVAERYPRHRRLDAGQRAAHHRALQRPVRPLVSARARRRAASCARCSTRCAATRAGDARDPRGQSRGAQLVQTEDLGFTHQHAAPARTRPSSRTSAAGSPSTCSCGRVDARAPAVGLPARAAAPASSELLRLADEPCPPDIIGINSYVTSERFLDDRLELLPAAPARRQRARRAMPTSRRCASPARSSAASRRGCAKPASATACRWRSPRCTWAARAKSSCAGCTRPGSARREGARRRRRRARRHRLGRVRQLRLEQPGHARRRPLRAGPVGRARRAAAADRAGRAGARSSATRPGARPTRCWTAPGWWQRDAAPEVPAARRGAGAAAARPAAADHRRHRHAGPGVRAAVRAARPAAPAAAPRRHGHRRPGLGARPRSSAGSPGRSSTPPASCASTRPSTTRASGARTSIGPGAAGAAPARAAACGSSTFSSDLVFDGDKAAPYVESDAPQPLNAYGRAKREAERRVLAIAPDALVIRTAAFFGPWDRAQLRDAGAAGAAARRALAGGRRPGASRRPTCRTWSHAALDLLIDGEHGIWHLANRGARELVGAGLPGRRSGGAGRGLVRAVPGVLLGQLAPRPGFAALSSERGVLLPGLEHALGRYMDETT